MYGLYSKARGGDLAVGVREPILLLQLPRPWIMSLKILGRGVSVEFQFSDAFLYCCMTSIEICCCKLFLEHGVFKSVAAIQASKLFCSVSFLRPSVYIWKEKKLTS
ncbi:hypothetical protein PanWU01x14_045820 [Parasponia andersonii]|uniref:Uncharacterized protein n=1 Tax=Parasponia andersonii TaxID=3476 RepID=A0A2P5DPK9_PARAD|nr:hypothetical protein PanWU01x14_045820 [Parasponia andersonii]